MKSFVLMILGFGLSAHASASPAPSKFENFKSTVRFATEVFANSECFIVLEESAIGLKVSLQDDNQQIGLFVSPIAKLALAPASYESRDGSFDRNFVVDGAGRLQIVHADDAFDTAEIWSGHQHLKCELD